MRHPTHPKIFVACLLALVPTANALPSLETAPPSEYFSGQTSDVVMQSTVATSTAGVANGGEFIPTQDSEGGNYNRRPFRFTLSLSTGFDDNIYTSSFDEESSVFSTVSLGIAFKAGDRQTTIDANLNFGGSYYWDRDDNFDPNVTFSLSLTHRFSPKLILSITSSLAYQSEPNFSSGIGQTRRRGDYVFGNIGVNLSQIFSRRFSAVYSYSVGGVVYEDDSGDSGVGDYITNTLGLQLRYLLKPTITLVGEYRFGLTTYESDNRDSSSNYLLAGLDFTLNRRLYASFRVGTQFRDSDDRGDETSPFLESTLTYTYAERSTVSWLNRYGFEESDFGEGSTRRTYRTGLTVSHAFGPRVSINGSAYYTNNDYDGTSGGGGGDKEQTVDLNINSSYALNRLVSFQVGYTYTTILSENSFREYDRNRVFAGVTFSF